MKQIAIYAVIALIVCGFGIYAYDTMVGFDTPADDVPDTQTIVVDTSTDVLYPEFDITPSAVTSGYNAFCTLNSDETLFTVPGWSNQTGHTIYEIDNSTWVDPRIQFICVPVPPAGSDADTLATIYFEVSNYDAYVDADTDNYRFMTKSSGKYQVNWSDGTNDWYVSGSDTMLMTGTTTLTLDFDVNQASFSRMDDNDATVMTITLHNEDWSWSETFDVSFVSQYSWGA
jgi:hypothetical protein